MTEWIESRTAFELALYLFLAWGVVQCGCFGFCHYITRNESLKR